MTFADRYAAYQDAAAAWQAERAAYAAWFQEAEKAKYAELRARDKAEGRDTSGKSVQGRRCVAHDVVMMSDEARARREIVRAAEAAYDAAKAAI